MRAVLLDRRDRQQRDGRLGAQVPEIGGRAVLPIAALHRASPNYCRLRHPAGCPKARQPWIIAGLPQRCAFRGTSQENSMSTPQRAAVAQTDNEVQELDREGARRAGHLRGVLAGAGRRDRPRHGEVRLRQRRDARADGRRRDRHRQLRGQGPQEEGQGARHLEQPEGQEVARHHRRGQGDQPRVRREADGRRRRGLPGHESDRDADVQRHVRAQDRQRGDLRAASEGAEVHRPPDERVHEDRQVARRPRQPDSDDQEGLDREDAGAHEVGRRRRRDRRRRDGQVARTRPASRRTASARATCR